LPVSEVKGFKGLAVELQESVQSFCVVENTKDSRDNTGKQQLADLEREWEHHLTTTHAIQIPKYGEVRAQSRTVCAPSYHHPMFLPVTK